MLDLPRYLLGVLELLLLGGFAWLGASAIRVRLVPSFTGAPAYLATAVVALALLIWTAELLGGFGWFKPALYVAVVAAAGLVLRYVWGGGPGGPSALLGFSPPSSRPSEGRVGAKNRDAAASEGPPGPPTPGVAMLLAGVISAAALVKFGIDVKGELATGMTGFDSTWYHGPFAAGFFQSSKTWDLHFIAPQFLAWFYPANAELFHAAGMLALGRDVLSPLLNLGWFVGCLLACWCIGRPYRVAPWSLALGAIALSLPVLADQAGEARNDIVGIFFLLAAVAIALNAGATGDDSVRSLLRIAKQDANASLLVGLAAGLAAGTKLNFLPPAAVLVLGLPFLEPAGKRFRALVGTFLAALAGGGYWYLRNLIHTGNPLPWFDHVGPVSLPAPEQPLGGREGHSVLGYLTDGSVWSDWFLPGLHGALTILWPLILLTALAGLGLCLVPHRSRSRFDSDSGSSLDRGRDFALPLAGLVGLAAIAAWLIAPTSASGPEGMPRGFESGLRYLAPALVLGFAVLPPALLPREAVRRGVLLARRSLFRSANSARGATRPAKKAAPGGHPSLPTGPAGRRAWSLGRIAVAVVVVAAIATGYPVQRHYLGDRYANPTFAAPGLNAAFKWADDISNARIATTGTRQYPLFGRDLSNQVQYIGEHKPHGGFTAPTTCRRWRQLLNEGHYDYVIATRDRIEPNKPPYPATARWTEGVGAEPILRKPPTIIFKLTNPLDPSACNR
ncbi:MAG TPA: hypothetical protein VFG58_02515 [Solirubrobacterales bacterium]|nr:hypothetical protein [Solirubrobacterales bacterium]